MTPAGTESHTKTRKTETLVVVGVFLTIMQRLHSCYQIIWVIDTFSGILKLAFIFLELLMHYFTQILRIFETFFLRPQAGKLLDQVLLLLVFFCD